MSRREHDGQRRFNRFASKPLPVKEGGHLTALDRRSLRVDRAPRLPGRRMPFSAGQVPCTPALTRCGCSAALANERIRFKTNRLAPTQVSRPGVVKGGDAPFPCQPSAACSRPDTGIGDIAFPDKPEALCHHRVVEHCINIASLAQSAFDSAVKHGDQCGTASTFPLCQRLSLSLSAATRTLC
jgi:hypothetical protein